MSGLSESGTARQLKSGSSARRWTSRSSRWLGWLLIFGIFAADLPMAHAADTEENERFKNVEIRVIRPRYFTKRKHLELGAQFSGVMNEAFIYTFMATGLLAYHFTETFAFELAASFGFNLDKEDKRILFDEFEIKTKIFRTLYSIEGDVQWTPVYGKWQLPSGRLIYFDTYLSFGGGLTGVDWKYKDFCTPPDRAKNPDAPDIKSDAVKSYPTFLMGLGQRYFINKETAVRWDIRNHSLMYNKFDVDCSADPSAAESGSGIHNNITLQVGASKFF